MRPRRIVVVGGGAAGLGCALSAAAAGAEVLLLENDGELGGTVRQAMIHTIAGLFDDEGELLNAGLPTELIERLKRASRFTEKRRIGKTWVLNADTCVYAEVVRHWISEMPGIEVCCRARVTKIVTDQERATALEYETRGAIHTAFPSALADATGSACLVRQIDSSLVADGCALGGFIVRLRGLSSCALQFPRGAGLLREIRKAAQTGKLPRECCTVWIDTGVYADEAYVKFNLRQEDFDASLMRGVADQLVEFVRAMDGFKDARIQNYGEFGVRDGGRIRGEYCLTETDVKNGRHFPDAACRASWPIEHWHPTAGLSLEYLPPGTDYEIPLRSLRVSGFENLWAPGKCLCAEPRAQASARMVGTCWAMGAAVGARIAEGTSAGESSGTLLS